MPIGITTTVSVNGSSLPGYFNILSNFTPFKSAFESKYPGSQVTLNGNIVTISINSTTEVYDDITLTSDSASQTFTFTDNNCGNTLFQLQDKRQTEEEIWKNDKPSEEEINIAYIKDAARGNLYYSASNEFCSIYNVDLNNSNIESIEQGTYSFVKQGDEVKWIDKKGDITDATLIEKLTDFLPENILEEFELGESEQIQYWTEKQESEQSLAIKELSALENSNISETGFNTLSAPLPSDLACNSGAGDICLLFGANLSASNSQVNNIITESSSVCNSSGGSLTVRKGDKIYFRVHSVANGNAMINWNPRVEYTNAAMTTVVDQNGESPFISQYSDGFVLSGASPVVFPGNGTAQITWPTITVNNPSDIVYYEVYKKVLSGAEANYSTIPETVIYQKTCQPGVSTLVTPSSNQIAGFNLASLAVTGTTNNPVTPTVTMFYFRVRSTSNVKWKQWQWKPKVTCITQSPVLNEAQTSEGTATFNDVKYPLPDYTIYKSFPCSSQYNLYDLALVGGTVAKSILPTLSGISFSGLKGQLNFVVKAGGVLIGKRVFTINNTSVTVDNTTAIPIPTTNAKLEIGFYSDDSKLIDIEESLLARVAGSSTPLATIRNTSTNALIANVFKANVNLFQRPNSKFGTMYRQWGQFAYNPSVVTGGTQTAYGPLIQEDKLLLTDANSQQIQNAANSAEGLFQNVNLETDYQTFVTNMNQFESNNQQLVNVPFVPLTASRNLSPVAGYQEKWQGLHAESYASENSYRASTLAQAYSGMDPEDTDTEQDVLQTGAYGITRYSTGESTNLSAGVNAGFQEAGVTVGVQGSKTINASSTMLTDYVDLNGDRYPDIVSKDKVQYTTKTGGLYSSVDMNVTYKGLLGDYTNSNWGIGASGSFYKGGKPSTNQPTSKRPQFIMFNGNNSTGISGNYSGGQSETRRMWTDINGDGMADLVSRNLITGVVTVAMNLGSNNLPLATGTQTTWGSFKLANGRSAAGGGGIGFNIWGGSIELGASLNKGTNHTDFSLVDMNGDGLVDLVTSTDAGLKVSINRGGNFGPETTWSTYNLNKQFESVCMATNLGASFALVFGIPFTSISLKLIDVNVNGSPYSTSTNNTRKNITDYDGDGYPDLLEEASPGTVLIKPSNIRRTDMLKSVTNPLGGKFTVNYKVITPSYDNPSAKWVMSDVIVQDGYDTTNDGFDTYKKKYEYEKPRYDRREREFYGFETVRTLDYKMDTSGNPVNVYRRTETKYHNRSYFLNGLVTDNTVYKGSAATTLFSKTVNTYTIRKLDALGNVDLVTAAQALTYDVGGREGRRSGAVLLTKTQQYIYELGQTPLTTEVNLTYNKYGAVTEYTDSGAPGTADDYKTTITYHDDAALLAKNMIALPKSVNVNAVTGNVLMRSRTTKVDTATGAVTEISVKLNGTENAITTYEYDIYGNVKKVTLPANETAQRMTYTYTYDTVNFKYVVGTLDAFTYTSSSTYNPRFDKLLSTTDMAGNSMTYTYDNFGRLLTVTAPKEIATGNPYTIKFEYYPTLADLPPGTCITQTAQFMPFAITKHYDVQNPTNDIETITIIDGLARPVQVKKDIQMNVGTAASPTLQERMSVSGMVMYDEFGRAVRQYHPWHEAKQCNINQLFNSTATTYYSESTLDEMDRPTKVKDPDGNPTDITYALGTDGFGASAHMTKTVVTNTTNPTTTEVYKDITGKVTSTKNVLIGSATTSIWTKFAYNAVGDIITYTDNEGLITSYSYDLAGRKLTMSNPDTGKSSYIYNPAGNIIKLQTANLLANTALPAADQYIKYQYDYNRVKTILYPQLPSSASNIANVYYGYGAAGSGNNTGRVIDQKDATGVQKFTYGKMGEVLSNTRTVVGPNIPTRTFVTQFDYDSWNRIETIIYPDGEKVNYGYDFGGNLSNIKTSISPSTYVQRIDYDYFEQRTYVKYGNNTETTYAYTDKLRRLDKVSGKTASNQVFLYGQYTYDKIGNITKYDNTAAFVPGNIMGGTNSNTYVYDNMNRLTSSTGQFTGSPQQAANNNDYSSSYTTTMEYNTTHGIAKKTQVHNKNGQAVVPNSYNSTYTYFPNTHRLDKVIDVTTAQQEQFVYDFSGNITQRTNSTTGVKKLYWDESHRLRAVVNTNAMQHNIYDAVGERVLKATAKIEALYNNGMPVDGSVTFTAYTTYPSGYLVVNENGKFSKHYYAGSEKVLSRIGDQTAVIFEAKPKIATTETQSTEEATSEPLDEDALRDSQIADLTDILEKADMGTPIFKDYEPEEDEETPADEPENGERAAAAAPMAAPLVNLYYYHPNHLGSCTYLTDANGQLYQFYLNLPFGETMAEQHSLTEDYESPYKFNGKELDTDTGYYYYGARYYDPRTSIWLSTDPLMEMYPSVNPYVYCIQNPINLTDPTGMSVEDGDDWYKNDATGEVKWINGSGDVAGHTNLTQQGNELQEVVINQTQDNYSWGDFKYDWNKNANRADKWAEGWGQDMGQFIANCHPGIAISNAYGAATDGKDIYGQDIGGTEASIQVAASLLPFLKVGKLFNGVTKVEQYSLKAAEDGFYPVMKRGFKNPQELTWLNKGDVWKFGTTKNPFTRYSQSFLDNTGNGLRYNTEFLGTLRESTIVEKMKILNFKGQNGFLPAGNKIIK